MKYKILFYAVAIFIFLTLTHAINPPAVVSSGIFLIYILYLRAIILTLGRGLTMVAYELKRTRDEEMKKQL